MAEFHIEHFGCRAARADGEALSSRLRLAGMSESELAAAEVVVVNTCSVTAEADRAARAFIRRTHRRNPNVRIVVTGCYAQRAPDELAAISGVSAVIGNSHKALAPEIVFHLSGKTASPAGAEIVPLKSLLNASTGGAVPIWADDQFAHSFIEEVQLTPGAQTRPNLKIQEGCGNRCTFCVIPQTRGGSRSLTADAVMRQVDGFVAAGGIELVLSGINLGRWGRDLPQTCDSPRTLAALVRLILENSGLPRLRLSSIEPMDWDVELVALMSEFGGERSPAAPIGGHAAPIGGRTSRLARHSHLPLQSGSDAVLRRMHRRYRPWHYAEKVAALLRAAGPELTLGADVMVGFPGETDAEFEETLAFVRSLPFGYLHLFPFSPRPGTKGWALHAANPVPATAVEERMAALRGLAAEKSQTHRAQFIGRDLECLTLHTPDDLAKRNRTTALTANFIPLEIDGQFTANQLLAVRISGVKPDSTLTAEAIRAIESDSWRHA